MSVYTFSLTMGTPIPEVMGSSGQGGNSSLASNLLQIFPNWLKMTELQLKGHKTHNYPSDVHITTKSSC